MSDVLFATHMDNTFDTLCGVEIQNLWTNAGVFDTLISRRKGGNYGKATFIRVIVVC